MTELVLKQGLLNDSEQENEGASDANETKAEERQKSKEQECERNDSVRKIARIRTVNTLRMMSVDETHVDTKRVEQILDFLRDANLYRGECAILQRAKMSRILLRKVDLGKANLQGAELGNANLQQAFLYKANLQTAQLVESDLQRANLWKANLQGAYLVRANLKDTKLQGSDLQRAYLLGANLQGADLEDANLQEAKMEYAKFNKQSKLPDGTNWTPDTDMARFTDPDHPNFWPSDNLGSPVNGDDTEDEVGK
jgi:hypothetical protein